MFNTDYYYVISLNLCSIGEDLDDLSGVKTFIARMAKAYIRRLPKNSGERTLPLPSVNESKPKSKAFTTFWVSL